MNADYFSIVAGLVMLAFMVYATAYIVSSARTFNRIRRSRRNDAKLRGVVASRVGVGKVELPQRADARTASPQAD